MESALEILAWGHCLGLCKARQGIEITSFIIGREVNDLHDQHDSSEAGCCPIRPSEASPSTDYTVQPLCNPKAQAATGSS